jgi:hypothetical protein
VPPDPSFRDNDAFCKVAQGWDREPSFESLPDAEIQYCFAPDAGLRACAETGVMIENNTTATIKLRRVIITFASTGRFGTTEPDDGAVTLVAANDNNDPEAPRTFTCSLGSMV